MLPPIVKQIGAHTAPPKVGGSNGNDSSEIKRYSRSGLRPGQHAHENTFHARA